MTALQKIKEMRQNKASAVEIADALNKEGYLTPRGRKWTPGNVCLTARNRGLKRLKKHRRRKKSSPQKTASSAKASTADLILEVLAAEIGHKEEIIKRLLK